MEKYSCYICERETNNEFSLIENNKYLVSSSHRIDNIVICGNCFLQIEEYIKSMKNHIDTTGKRGVYPQYDHGYEVL